MSFTSHEVYILWPSLRVSQSSVFLMLHSSIKRQSSCLSLSLISFVALGSVWPLCEGDLRLFCHTLIIPVINHSAGTSVRCVSQLCFHTILIPAANHNVKVPTGVTHKTSNSCEIECNLELKSCNKCFKGFFEDNDSFCSKVCDR